MDTKTPADISAQATEMMRALEKKYTGNPEYFSEYLIGYMSSFLGNIAAENPNSRNRIFDLICWTNSFIQKAE